MNEVVDAGVEDDHGDGHGVDHGHDDSGVNLLVPMSGGKMERGVVAHICCVHASSSTHLVMVMVDWW